MSEYISIGDSLIVTLFSISMVFLVLIIISIFISMLKVFDGKKQEPLEAKHKKEAARDIIKSQGQGIDKNPDDEEIIAVISAALAASLGVSLPQINIKSIKRVNTSATAWSRAGRQEQIHSKL